MCAGILSSGFSHPVSSVLGSFSSLGKESAPGVETLKLADAGRGLMPGCEAGVKPDRAWWAQLGSGVPEGHRTGLSLCTYFPGNSLGEVPSRSPRSLDPSTLISPLEVLEISTKDR